MLLKRTLCEVRIDRDIHTNNFRFLPNFLHQVPDLQLQNWNHLQLPLPQNRPDSKQLDDSQLHLEVLQRPGHWERIWQCHQDQPIGQKIK